MFNFLKPDPLSKLQKEYDELQGKAFQAQRNGNIRGYSDLTAQAEAVFQKMEQLKSHADK